MTGRAYSGNPLLQEDESPTPDVVELMARQPPPAAFAGTIHGPRTGRPNWATFTNAPPRNAVPPKVTDRDRASIDAAVSAGRVRRVGFDGKEIA